MSNWSSTPQGKLWESGENTCPRVTPFPVRELGYLSVDSLPSLIEGRLLHQQAKCTLQVKLPKKKCSIGRLEARSYVLESRS